MHFAIVIDVHHFQLTRLQVVLKNGRIVLMTDDRWKLQMPAFGVLGSAHLPALVLRQDVSTARLDRSHWGFLPCLEHKLSSGFRRAKTVKKVVQFDSG